MRAKPLVFKTLASNRVLSGRVEKAGLKALVKKVKSNLCTKAVQNLDIRQEMQKRHDEDKALTRKRAGQSAIQKLHELALVRREGVKLILSLPTELALQIVRLVTKVPPTGRTYDDIHSYKYQDIPKYIHLDQSVNALILAKVSLLNSYPNVYKIVDHEFFHANTFAIKAWFSHGLHNTLAHGFLSSHPLYLPYPTPRLTYLWLDSVPPAERLKVRHLEVNFPVNLAPSFLQGDPTRQAQITHILHHFSLLLDVIGSAHPRLESLSVVIVVREMPRAALSLPAYLRKWLLWTNVFTSCLAKQFAQHRTNPDLVKVKTAYIGLFKVIHDKRRDVVTDIFDGRGMDLAELGQRLILSDRAQARVCMEIIPLNDHLLNTDS